VDTVEEEVVIEVEEPLYIERAVDGVFFTPQRVPVPAVPEDTGIVSERDLKEDSKEGERLRFLFRRAYRTALTRDIPLLGVLGIDRVHRWPENSNLTWAQNWRSAASSLNSWGMPSLVLAMLNSGGDEVFTVSGDILDIYGKNLGLGGANGVLGYGAPRGNSFFLKFTDYTLPALAQRFDKGLIYVTNTGIGAFIAEEAPSDIIALDEMAGFYVTDDVQLRQNLKTMFWRAYKSLVDQYERGIKADGPVEYVDFDKKTMLIDMTERSFYVSGLFVQYYDGGRFAVALSSAVDEDGAAGLYFPLGAYIIAPPFSEILLGAVRLPSSSGLSPHPFEVYADTPAFIKSIALYGIPLTDSFVSIETMSLSQRFSKGVFHSNILY
jgi:hypothetical protein